MQISTVPMSVKLMIVLSSIITSAAATNFDDKKNVICATTEVVACISEQGCMQGSASQFDLPFFIRIDFAKKHVSASKESGIAHVSPIKNMELTEKQVIIQGIENHRGWTAAIDRENGNMSITSSGADLNFVLAGHCTYEGGH